MMKRFPLVFLMAVCLCTALYAQDKPSKPKKTYPKFIELIQEKGLSEKNALFQEYFDLRSSDELRLSKTFRDDLGFEHQKFQQYYKGIKVEGGEYTLHAKKGKVTHMNGQFLSVTDLNVEPYFSPEGALNQAIAEVGAKHYMWEEGQVGEHQHHNHNHDHDHDIYSRPEGDLVIIADVEGIKDSRLTYKFDIYAAEPISRSYVYIDAHTGELVQRLERLHEADVAASGNSLYNGNVNFTADFTGSNYRLRQTSNGNGVETYDMNNSTNYGNATDITSGSTSFNHPTGVQAHWGAERTHSYFLSRHSRNSYNGSGAVIRSYVSYDNNYVNAFWDGSRMTYGDGDGVNYGPLVSLDIVGHEITHGVTEFSANLAYQRESGALNESFSDIFGEAIERYATGTNDWKMGTDMGIGGSGAIRAMDTPNQYNDPDTYGGTHWQNPNCGTPTRFNDYCGVHTNSGVQNKWFYILSQGESGTNDLGNAYSVSSIGITKAANVAYRNLTVYLGVNSTYAEARTGAIQSARDLYGADSAEEIAVTNAWYAVGVGSEYQTPIGCQPSPLTLTITLDNYPEETSWTVQNSSGTTVASGAYSTANPDGSTVNETINLGAGDYTFTINDSYGDGICCSYGNGSYTLSSGSTTIASGGAFGSSESTNFCISSGGGDTQAPSNPSNLSASGTTQTSTNLSWNASTDNVGVTGYNVYVGGSLNKTVTGTSTTVTGLTANTSYAMHVTAVDAAGNESGQSNTVNVTTQSSADTQAPSNPTNLSASGTTETTTDLSWNASTDNVGVTGYNVYVDGSNIGSVTGTSSQVTGLTAGTTYAMYVTAVDAAGNESGQSNTVNVTTTGGGGGGTTAIFAHYFETGWDGWQDGGSDCYRYSGSRSYEGSYSIRIRDNSGTASAMTSSTYNVSGYDQLELKFFFYPNSMETGEDFWVRYYNGSSWTTVATYASGSDFNNNTFYEATVTLSSSNYTFPSNAQFRIQCDASGNADRVYIDGVRLNGINTFALTNGSLASGQSIRELYTPQTFGPASTEEELDADEGVAIFPNPAKDQLSIRLLDADEVLSVKIFTVDGKLIRNLGVINDLDVVDISQLPSGVYFLSVETNEEVVHEKFVKQ